MKLYKTYDKDGFLRLEEDGGAALTLYLYGKCAYMLSITVPERDRREGIGRALLSAAGDIISEKGSRRIEADFLKSIPGFLEFMKECGFETEDAAPLYSMDIGEVLSSPVVERAMKKEVKGASFSPLAALSAMGWNTFFSFILRLGVYPTNSDIKAFDMEISGVVFDDEGEIKAAVLCSRVEKGIFIEFLSGNARKNPGFILEALKGIKKGLTAAHEDKSLKSVFLVAVNEGVKGLLATLEKGGLKIEGTDMCVLAQRKVEKKKRNSDDLKVSERIDDSLENKWMNELGDMAFQKNVTWKLPFARGHRLV